MMPTALPDTNAVSDLMRDHPQVKARLGKHSDPLATSVVVIGEIRYGLDRLPPGKKRTDLETRAQAILAVLRVEPITPQVAEAYGQLKASLEGQGLNLEDNDLWIAATALSQTCIIVTRDHLFTKITSLQVEDWTV
jgi:predicted nucleic acid-binding protein